MTMRHSGSALVLLVARSAELRRGGARDLTRNKLTVVTDADGSTAYHAAIMLLPEIVVTELDLPGLDGMALCRALKTDPRTEAVPVVAVERCDGTTTFDEIAGAGFDDLIAAPYEPSSFVARVREIIDRAMVPRFASAETGVVSRSRRGSIALALHDAVIESRHLASGSPSRVRCPDCNCPLVWHERQTIAGQQFDYFQPCARGCGFFFFDHTRCQLKRLLG